jgi:septum formation protein
VPTLVLASTSPSRRALLARLVRDFEAVPHRVDEPAHARALGSASPDRVALSLACAKALSVAAEHPSAHVLGSDQVVDLDGEILGQPGDASGARAQLRRLAGRRHRLVTAIALRAPDGETATHLDVQAMQMRALSDDAIARYVAADDPVLCCGSYKIEALGVTLFEETVGSDPTGIQGLPLLALARLLRDAGWTLP